MTNNAYYVEYFNHKGKRLKRKMKDRVEKHFYLKEEIPYEDNEKHGINARYENCGSIQCFVVYWEGWYLEEFETLKEAKSFFNKVKRSKIFYACGCESRTVFVGDNFVVAGCFYGSYKEFKEKLFKMYPKNKLLGYEDVVEYINLKERAMNEKS